MNHNSVYTPANNPDNCSMGFIAQTNGSRSHQLVTDALTILENLAHRRAPGHAGRTGEGAGVLTQVPHRFFRTVTIDGIDSLPPEGTYGVGMLFLPQDAESRTQLTDAITSVVTGQHCTVLGWRRVPIDETCLHAAARKSMPFILQLFVTCPDISGEQLERKLFIVRKAIEKMFAQRFLPTDQAYIPSFSSTKIVYKGTVPAHLLERFYPDLSDTEFQSGLVVLHERYSTGTPAFRVTADGTGASWATVQPFRGIAHNGVINSISGNVKKMKGREARLASAVLGDDLQTMLPVIDERLTDSGIFDAVFELLTQSGRSMEHAFMMMVPEAFGPKLYISQDKRAFYEYHAALMEPWDGPGAFIFTDGNSVGAALDRNGLRPLRYTITRTGMIVCASETGVLPIPPSEILKKGRLGPGKMLMIDTKRKRALSDNEIKSTVSRSKPYRRWLEKNTVELKGLFQVAASRETVHDSLHTLQQAFGYTQEDLTSIITPMALNGQETVCSMGNDAALAVLSEKPQLLSNYFRQFFAQVTHPPIDPYREHSLMSLMSFIGREGNLLEENPKSCHQLKLPHPLLTNDDMAMLRALPFTDFQSCTLPIFFDAAGNDDGLDAALRTLCEGAVQKVDEGYCLLILSDRGVNETRVPIPPLLALSAVHHFLIDAGKRHLVGIIIETGEARDIMHIATLIGFGASAINPYLVFETIADLKKKGLFPAAMKTEIAIDNYITAIKKGLMKTMSKMGISTIRSYRGAQLFEAIGLADALVSRFFPGTPSHIGGLDLKHIAVEASLRHARAFSEPVESGAPLPSGGTMFFSRDGERHQITAESIVLLQESVKNDDYSLYKRYTREIDGCNGNGCTIRDLWSVAPDKQTKQAPIPMESIEPEESILKRFSIAAISLGSVSKEAYETIAAAVNRMGLFSNCGEGGAYEEAYPLGQDATGHAVRQIASARFGVTCGYLTNCKEIQIKIAQGAKPGEGGQLPAYKVDEVIARVRLSVPGVTHTSPPPHHDVYSIGDLAQLIYDMKNINPSGRISVKLVAEAGIGAIALGVANAGADVLCISSPDGGTGASLHSSMKNIGIPWEIGLVEAHRTLTANAERSRVRLRVDGKLKSGRDIIIAAALGADEFGFATIPLIALGCLMARKCHLNICPTGIGTQDKELRKRFAGKPEYIIRLLHFFAREVRVYLSMLGLPTLVALTGRTSVLSTNAAVLNRKSTLCDFSALLRQPSPASDSPITVELPGETNASPELDTELIEKSLVLPARQRHVKLFAPIRNCHRSVGVRLSGEITRRYGGQGLVDTTITCKFIGSAGQSFGAFLVGGISFELEGDANDFVGKGLCGGRIVVIPPRLARFNPHTNIIAGNANLFGATGGELYVNGRAGERFAVRNCGATAVVEGVGDNGCEYMTGGIIVILGRTGINFAAGMSGGIVYVLDDNQLFDTRCNLETVNIEPLTGTVDQEQLFRLIQNHVQYTQSGFAKHILSRWEGMVHKFVKVMPIDYKRTLERYRDEESTGAEMVPATEEVYW